LDLADLPEVFRAHARFLAPYAPGAAAAWLEAAQLLAGALVGSDNEPLTIATAAAEAGWTYEGLRRRVTRDPTLNVGSARAPRITRRVLRALGGGRGSRSTLPGPVTSGGVGAFGEAVSRGRSAPPRASVSPGAAAASPSAEPTRLAAIVESAVARRQVSRPPAPGRRSARQAAE
jgi:hypothetical protein